MPTYVYKNLETGEYYELRQSMRDDAYTHHPETGAAIKRVPVAPAIAFKGSGFYVTDSRASEGGKAAGKKESAAGTSGASSDAGTSSSANPNQTSPSPTTSSPTTSSSATSSAATSGKGSGGPA